MTTALDSRSQALLEAQLKAKTLFDTVEASGLIRAGTTESQLNASVYALAKKMYGITKYWHKRIVRAGKNTLLPYAENPPDLTIADDDIVFLDLGPVFEDWEADFGRTFILGDDPVKHRLRENLALAFDLGRQHFKDNPDITGSELYRFTETLAARFGWHFGGPIAGHLIGQFPHERIEGNKIDLYIHPKNHSVLRNLGSDGQPRHWILEIHFVDLERQFGGFYEELLTVG